MELSADIPGSFGGEECALQVVTSAFGCQDHLKFWGATPTLQQPHSTTCMSDEQQAKMVGTEEWCVAKNEQRNRHKGQSQGRRHPKVLCLLIAFT